MICVDVLGMFTSNLRFVVLSLTSIDVRLMCGDICCRAQLMLAYMVGDLSTWSLVCLCCERFYIMLFPLSSYARDRKNIRSAIIVTCLLYLFAFLANGFLLSPQEDVCAEAYSNFAVVLWKMICVQILPTTIVSVSVIGLMIILCRRSRWSCRFGGSLNTNTTSRGLATSRWMVIIGLLFLASSLAVFVNNLTHPTYVNTLTAHNCHVDDYLFNAISIMFWTCVCIRTYVFMLSSSGSRKDLFCLFKALWCLLLCRPVTA
ncbi:hypothetical protein EG68_03062 [Paragonimus skrjabini miyazakii]|uniref:G-protein coupled receptors family 1 profile domain-containing protein n=1 Tax=Paragonimus skrjabini miyazakii TaxID=59628 RepID=A0A8S9YX52_9TREM|nr:hypothetical protein EG68_03062 [Paragonimus skrjabini miyazakii]